jgi:hypothetical protein
MDNLLINTSLQNSNSSYSSKTSDTKSDEKSFETILEETQEEKKDIKTQREERKKLIEELLKQVRISVNTGLTPQELEEINKLMEKIQEAMEKSSKDANYKSVVEDLLSQLKGLLNNFSERLTGKYLEGTDNNNKGNSLKEINQTFEKLTQDDSSSKENYIKYFSSNNNSKMELEEELKKFQ